MWKYDYIVRVYAGTPISDYREIFKPPVKTLKVQLPLSPVELGWNRIVFTTNGQRYTSTLLKCEEGKTPVLFARESGTDQEEIAAAYQYGVCVAFLNKNGQGGEYD
jgi:hypothetical protein